MDRISCSAQQQQKGLVPRYIYDFCKNQTNFGKIIFLLLMVSEKDSGVFSPLSLVFINVISLIN